MGRRARLALGYDPSIDATDPSLAASADDERAPAVRAAGALVVQRVLGADLVAVLARGARRSLPKVRVTASTASLEDAARFAGERWTGLDLRPTRALGVALVEAAGQAFAAAFHELRVVTARERGAGPGPPRAAALTAQEADGWALTWLAPERAAIELTQREERLLVERALPRRGVVAALGRVIRSELLPRARRERWLAVALAASASFAPLAAWLGWLAPAPWSFEHVPRVALAALLGGLTSAALRLAPDGDTPLLGAIAGAALGAVATTAVAAGVFSGLTLANPGVLGVAFASGFLERALLRRT